MKLIVAFFIEVVRIPVCLKFKMGNKFIVWCTMHYAADLEASRARLALEQIEFEEDSEFVHKMKRFCGKKLLNLCDIKNVVKKYLNGN